eukprot:3464750-Pyramimonas_sp.AAC.1
MSPSVTERVAKARRWLRWRPWPLTEPWLPWPLGLPLPPSALSAMLRYCRFAAPSNIAARVLAAAART